VTLKKSLLALTLLAAGIALTFSLAPFSYWPLAIVGLAFFHYSLHQATVKAALWQSLLFSAALFLSGSYWVYVSMHSFGGAPPVLAGFLTAGFCLGIAALLLPFIFFYQRFLSNTALGQTLGFAAIWVLCEWFRSWFLTGFPWLYIGYSQTTGPLASYAPILSVYGLSFIIAFSAASISLCLRTKSLHYSLIISAVLWLLSFPLAQIEFTENSSDEAVAVALLQPNTDLTQKWLPQNRLPIINGLKNATDAVPKGHIVIWPETAAPWNYPASAEHLESLSADFTSQDKAVILGVPSFWRQDNRYIYHNSMLGIGTASGIYHKQKLVPFGEYVPLESLLRGLIAFFDLPMSSFRPGLAGQQSFSAQGLKIHPYICYEVVYPNFVAHTAGQADILLTVSNDAWFGQSIGPLQHLQMAQMRALENGRYMLRSTNNGVTAIIDHRGNISQQLPQFEQGVLIAEVYARKGLTPVAQYGTLAPIIFCLLIVISQLLLQRRQSHSPKFKS
jgi:apolipoprotein N-acyltransferase